MGLSQRFQEIDPLECIRNAGLLEDAARAFDVEVGYNQLPNTPLVKNAYILFLQYLIEHTDQPKDVLSLSYAAQFSGLKPVYLMLDQEKNYLAPYVDNPQELEQIICAALLKPVLQENPERRDMLTRLLTPQIINRLDQQIYTETYGGKYFDDLTDTNKALYLTLAIKDAKDLYNAVEELSEEGENDIDILLVTALTLYKKGLALNLQNKTALEQDYTDTLSKVITTIKSRFLKGEPQSAQILPFPQLNK